jgi:hypothetical protein
LETNMDTATVVVGQKVWMESGMYAQEGKVVKVTLRGAEVELLRAEGPIGLKYQIRFDTAGNARNSRGIYEGNFNCTGSSWRDPVAFFIRLFGPVIPGTHEYGPWKLVDPQDPRYKENEPA